MKVLKAFLLSAGLVMFSGQAAMAQVGLHFYGLYAFDFDDSRRDGSNADNTFGGGAALVFRVSDFARLDLGGDYFRVEHKEFSSNKARFIPVTATLRLGIPVEDIAFIYAGGGAGYSFNEFDIPNVSSSDLELKDSFTYHACAGAELLFNEHFGIRGEFRYVWLRPEQHLKPLNMKSDIKFDHMQVRGGVIFYF